MSDRTPNNADAVDDRDPVDVLADEFAARIRAGEAPLMQEYVEQYPDYADQIQELFPGVALLEQLSEKQESEASFAQRPRQDGLPPGYRFGDIEIVREVGRGGMGIVYEGYQHSLNRCVAVKAMSGSAVHSGKQAMRFQREAQAAAQLHHTNIVPVFGVGEQEGTSFYVMQLIHGLGLDAILTELVRKTHLRKPEQETEAAGSDDETGAAVSARGFADVLVSGQLSNSSSRAVGGSSAVAAPATPSPEDAATVVYQQQLAVDGPSELEHREEDRTEDQTGELGSGETSKSFVRSSFELRDDPRLAPSVRSSLVLRDELPDGEMFVPPEETADEDIVEDPSLASLGTRYWRNIARVGLQVAAGLQHAHTQGTLHRDIKPANILLDADGIAWIADFGLAKLLQQDDVTKTGDVVGTLRYMAPEQFHGETDARSDLYSFGLTLYELLTLRPAYEDTDRQRLIAKKLTPHDPPHPRKYHHGIPKDLETIVLKCLAWEPDRRYRSAGALVADLQAFLEDRPIQARPISVVERFGRWCKRQPLVASLSTAVLLLLITTVSLLSFLYVRADNRAQEMTELKESAEAATLAAELANADAEQIAEVSWQALDKLYDTLVPERFTGPVEASVDVEDESDSVAEEENVVETESLATVLSPQLAATLEQLLPEFDKIAEIRGADDRHLEISANANRKVGNLRLRLSQHAEAAAAFERAIQLYQQLERNQVPTQETSLMLARIYNGLSLAEERLRGGRPRTALQHSLRVLSRPVLDPSSPTVRFELASTHYLMADHPPFVRFRGGDRGSSQRSGRGESNRSSSRGSSNERRSSSNGVLGEPQANPGAASRAGGMQRSNRRFPSLDHRVSEQHLQTATGILERLIAEYSNVPEYQFLLALCHIELRDPKHTPDRSTREQSLVKAIGILEGLVSTYPNEPDYRYQLSEAYEQRYFQWKRGLFPLSRLPLFWPDAFDTEDESRTELTNLPEAQTDLEHAVQLSTELLRQQPNVPRYADSHLWLLFHLADVYAVQGDWKQAEGILDGANQLARQMKQAFPDTEKDHRRRGPRLEVLLGHVFVQSKQFAEARNLLEPLAEESRDESNHWLGMFYRGAFTLLAEALDALEEPAEAEAARQEADRLKRKFDRSRPSGSSGTSPRGSSGRSLN